MTKTLRRFQRLLLTLAVLGLLLPSPQTILAAQLQAGAEKQEAVLIDLALGENGVLRGQFLNANGQAVANSTVHLHDGQNLLAAKKTDEEGNFEFENVHGGIYAVFNEQSFAGVRAWAPKTAPPSASSGILLVEGTTQRANYLEAFGIGGLIVLGGILAIIAVAASDRDNGS